MSRYCGDAASKPTLQASLYWRDRALHADGSVFSARTLWTLGHLEEIDRHYVKNVLETDATFLEKLKQQLEPTTPEAKQLVAEMLWVMLGDPRRCRLRRILTLLWLATSRS